MFIAARVMYRILFDGAATGAPVLLDLPAFRLPAPYAHVKQPGDDGGGGEPYSEQAGSVAETQKPPPR